MTKFKTYSRKKLTSRTLSRNLILNIIDADETSARFPGMVEKTSVDDNTRMQQLLDDEIQDTQILELFTKEPPRKPPGKRVLKMKSNSAPEIDLQIDQIYDRKIAYDLHKVSLQESSKNDHSKTGYHTVTTANCANTYASIARSYLETSGT